jgi:hypothetical protein
MTAPVVRKDACAAAVDGRVGWVYEYVGFEGAAKASTCIKAHDDRWFGAE